MSWRRAFLLPSVLPSVLPFLLPLLLSLLLSSALPFLLPLLLSSALPFLLPLFLPLLLSSALPFLLPLLLSFLLSSILPSLLSFLGGPAACKGEYDIAQTGDYGTGKPGNAYEARHNVELGVSLSHNFDMHGGRDRKDGTQIAGDWMKIHHNTFRGTRVVAIVIRGVPQEQAEIHHNWFFHPKPGGNVVRPWPTGGETHVDCHSNAYGQEQPAVLDPGDGE